MSLSILAALDKAHHPLLTPGRNPDLHASIVCLHEGTLKGCSVLFSRLLQVRIGEATRVDLLVGPPNMQASCRTLRVRVASQAMLRVGLACMLPCTPRSVQDLCRGLRAVVGAGRALVFRHCLHFQIDRHKRACIFNC